MKLSKIKSLIAAPEDSVVHYITSSVADLTADENGVVTTPTLAITLAQWKRVGGNAAEQCDDCNFFVRRRKGSSSAIMGTVAKRDSISLYGQDGNGYDCIEGVLTDDSGNEAYVLPIHVHWKSGNACHIVLDTYESVVIVDDNGLVVRAPQPNHARFYKNGNLVRVAASQWIVSASKTHSQGWGVEPSVTDGVLNIAFREDQAVDVGIEIVTVSTVQDGTTYVATWVLDFQREVTRYELVAEGGPLTYNATEKTWENSFIDILVYKTSSDGTRVRLSSLPSQWSMYWPEDDSVLSIRGSGNARYWRLDVSASDYWEYGDNIGLTVLLRDASSKVVASLPISINTHSYAAVRPRKWGTGVAFLSGGLGERFVDIVYVDDALKWFECKKTLTAAANTAATESVHKPQTTDGNQWFRRVVNFDAVATTLLLAQAAYIQNLGVQNVHIGGWSNDDGTCPEGYEAHGGSIVMRDSQGKLLFKVAEGVVNARSGLFENIKISGQSTFGGLQKKEKLQITSETLSQYCKEGYSVNVLDLEKTGTWIEFSSFRDGVEVWLPSLASSGTTYGGQDEVRSLVGNTILIYYTGEQQGGNILVYGSIRAENGSHVNFISLQEGDYARFECKAGVYAGGEEIYWEYAGV